MSAPIVRLTQEAEDRIANLAAQDRDAAEARVAEEGPAFWEDMQEADEKVERFRRDREREVQLVRRVGLAATELYRRRLLMELSMPAGEKEADDPRPRDAAGFPSEWLE